MKLLTNFFFTFSDMTKAQNLGNNPKPAAREDAALGPRQQQRKHQQKGKKKGKH